MRKPDPALEGDMSDLFPPVQTDRLTNPPPQETMPDMGAFSQRQLVDFLTKLRRSGWIKRQGIKVSAFVSAGVAGWLLGNPHIDAENVTVLAAGAGALVLYLWEVAWSAIEHRTSSEKIVAAMVSDKPTTKGEALTQLHEIAKPTTPVQ